MKIYYYLNERINPEEDDWKIVDHFISDPGLGAEEIFSRFQKNNDVLKGYNSDELSERMNIVEIGYDDKYYITGEEVS